MIKKQKLCFVIMGFGKKTDQSTGKTLDLDKTYNNIIKPAVEKAGLQCVRGDEIQDSGLIDKSMYALLMHADLVVADISTYNPNAIYELGIRHAVRPCSTIIIKEQEGTIPFDLDHTRIFHYAHLGKDIGVDEAKRCKKSLVSMIASILDKQIIDSPLYDYIKDIEPPKLTQREYQRIIGDLSKREENIFTISERAKHCMDDSEFMEAALLWEKAEFLVPNEAYFTQQHALAKYKSKEPSVISSLSDALQIIKKLDSDGETNDPETLGLTGAIYKRMWHVTADVECLTRAIHYYGKGFKIRRDCYNGENYALCLNIAESIEEDVDEKTFYRISAKRIRMEIVEILGYLTDKNLIHESIDKWSYATLANCYYGLGDVDNGLKFENIYLGFVSLEWELETYFESKNMLIDLVEI